MGLSWQQGPPGAGLIRAGVTDFAQQSLGDVVDVTLPRPGDTWRGVDIESAKRVSELIAPRHWGHQYPPTLPTLRTRTATPGDPGDWSRPVCIGELMLAPSPAGPKASPPPQPTDNLDHLPGATARRVRHPRSNHD